MSNSLDDITKTLSQTIPEPQKYYRVYVANAKNIYEKAIQIIPTIAKMLKNSDNSNMEKPEKFNIALLAVGISVEQARCVTSQDEHDPLLKNPTKNEYGIIGFILTVDEDNLKKLAAIYGDEILPQEEVELPKKKVLTEAEIIQAIKTLNHFEGLSSSGTTFSAVNLVPENPEMLRAIQNFLNKLPSFKENRCHRQGTYIRMTHQQYDLLVKEYTLKARKPTTINSSSTSSSTSGLSSSIASSSSSASDGLTADEIYKGFHAAIQHAGLWTAATIPVDYFTQLLLKHADNSEDLQTILNTLKDLHNDRKITNKIFLNIVSNYSKQLKNNEVFEKFLKEEKQFITSLKASEKIIDEPLKVNTPLVNYYQNALKVINTILQSPNLEKLKQDQPQYKQFLATVAELSELLNKIDNHSQLHDLAGLVKQQLTNDHSSTLIKLISERQENLSQVSTISTFLIDGYIDRAVALAELITDTDKLATVYDTYVELVAKFGVYPDGATNIANLKILKAKIAGCEFKDHQKFITLGQDINTRMEQPPRYENLIKTLTNFANKGKIGQTFVQRLIPKDKMLAAITAQLPQMDKSHVMKLQTYLTGDNDVTQALKTHTVIGGVINKFKTAQKEPDRYGKVLQLVAARLTQIILAETETDAKVSRARGSNSTTTALAALTTLPPTTTSLPELFSKEECIALLTTLSSSTGSRNNVPIEYYSGHQNDEELEKLVRSLQAYTTYASSAYLPKEFGRIQRLELPKGSLEYIRNKLKSATVVTPPIPTVAKDSPITHPPKAPPSSQLSVTVSPSPSP